MIVDVCAAPRAIQEEAFRRGLIPYIPDITLSSGVVETSSQQPRASDTALGKKATAESELK